MKRITKILASLALLLGLFPSTVSAHNATNYWEIQEWNGYTHWIWVCDIDISATDWEARFVDAMTEWDEIGGEFVYLNSGWTSQECTTFWNTSQGVVKISLAPLGGNTLASADVFYTYVSGQWYIDSCHITLDSDGVLASIGNYWWYAGTGQPGSGSNLVDLESVVVHELGHCVGIPYHGELQLRDERMPQPPHDQPPVLRPTGT